MKAMQKIVGSLIVGCVLACWLISNTDAQPTLPLPGSANLPDSATQQFFDNNNGGSGGFSYTPPDYGTNLWVAKLGLASGNLVGIISSTTRHLFRATVEI